jgi:hypothetical protein
VKSDFVGDLWGGGAGRDAQRDEPAQPTSSAQPRCPNPNLDVSGEMGRDLPIPALQPEDRERINHPGATIVMSEPR